MRGRFFTSIGSPTPCSTARAMFGHLVDDAREQLPASCRLAARARHRCAGRWCTAGCSGWWSPDRGTPAASATPRSAARAGFEVAARIDGLASAGSIVSSSMAMLLWLRRDARPRSISAHATAMTNGKMARRFPGQVVVGQDTAGRAGRCQRQHPGRRAAAERDERHEGQEVPGIVRRQEEQARHQQHGESRSVVCGVRSVRDAARSAEPGHHAERDERGRRWSGPAHLPSSGLQQRDEPEAVAARAALPRRDSRC